ncbi:DegV family protein [Lachnospiraceae bacterium KM106-2]|nr:DegV family protein [Lachnospiraceae bacterium KM106-2]
MNYQIISDSSCDLTKEFEAAHQVEIVPFYVSFDEEHYYKERLEVNHDDFYSKMIEEKSFPKTSLPSIQDYTEVFEKYASKGLPMICTCISAKFSGSYQSALNAKDIVLETYPDAKITVIDSTLNTVELGLLVKEIVRMRDNGVSYEDSILHIERIKPTGRIIFTTGDMAYLKHGGRIGKLLKFASGTLGIKPLIIMKEGEIFPAGITRSRNKSKTKLLDLAKDFFSDKDINDYEIAIGTGIDYEEAEEFRKSVEAALNLDRTLAIEIIGVTVGTHTGPHPIGMGLLKRYDS